MQISGFLINGGFDCRADKLIKKNIILLTTLQMAIDEQYSMSILNILYS